MIVFYILLTIYRYHDIIRMIVTCTFEFIYFFHGNTFELLKLVRVTLTHMHRIKQYSLYISYPEINTNLKLASCAIIRLFWSKKTNLKIKKAGQSRSYTFLNLLFINKNTYKTKYEVKTLVDILYTGPICASTRSLQ
jgi:hypothetical protein